MNESGQDSCRCILPSCWCFLYFDMMSREATREGENLSQIEQVAMAVVRGWSKLSQSTNSFTHLRLCNVGMQAFCELITVFQSLLVTIWTTYLTPIGTSSKYIFITEMPFSFLNSIFIIAIIFSFFVMPNPFWYNNLYKQSIYTLSLFTLLQVFC